MKVKNIAILIKQCKWQLGLVALSLAGITLCIYLWYVHLNPAQIQCSISGCHDVLTGEYSELFGAPVAVFGAFFYAVLLLLFGQAIWIKDKALVYMTKLILGIGMAYTLYLRYLEFVKIGDWCQWCWGSVAILLAIAIIYIIWQRKEKK